MKEIDIMDFLKILWKKAWIIALVAVLCAAIGFSYCTLMVTPEYSSKAVMVVTVGDMTSDIVDSKDYAVVLSMMPTYVAQFREGTDFYKTIADSVNYSYKKESAEEYSAAKIKSMCTWSFTEEQLHATVVVTGTNQNDVQLILEAIDKNADNYLKPGGKILYSTCTLRKAENEDIVKRFLAENSDFSLEYMHTFMPFIDGTDGFFTALLVK